MVGLKIVQTELWGQFWDLCQGIGKPKLDVRVQLMVPKHIKRWKRERDAGFVDAVFFDSDTEEDLDLGLADELNLEENGAEDMGLHEMGVGDE